MALWDNSGINTNETAFVFNKMAVKKAIPIVANMNAFLKMALGQKEEGATPGIGSGFTRLNNITGKSIEVTLLGQLGLPTTVSDANQTAALATPNVSSGAFGAAVFDIAHYSYGFDVLDSELLRYKGDELKTASFLDEVFNRILLTYQNTWGTAVSLYDPTNSVDVSRTILGSWVHAIAGNNNLSDTQANMWVTAASGGGSYGGLVRNGATAGVLTDGNNPDFRGNVFSAQGDLTLPKLLTAKNRCITNLGMPDFAMAGETMYTKIQGLAASYTQTEYDETWQKFQGAYVMYAGMRVCLDSYCNSAVVGIFDSSTWNVYTNMTDFASGGLIKDFTRKAVHLIHTSPWIQLICKAPNRNAILGGLTS